MSVANLRGFQALQKKKEIDSLRKALIEGQSFALSGMRESLTPFCLSLLLEDLHRPALVILQDEDDLEEVLSEFKIWTQKRDLFQIPFVHASVTNLEHAALMQQMKAIRAMLERDSERGIWISTLKTLEAPCFSLDFIDQPVLEFEKGKELDLQELMQHLTALGFQKEDKVDQRGDVALRGGILDIFPRFSQHPVRIEFFGNEIETIREFSVVTQKSLRQMSRFVMDDVEEEQVAHLQRDGKIIDYLPEGLVVFQQEPELSGRELDESERCSGWVQALGEEGRDFRSSRKWSYVPYGRLIEDAKCHFDGEILEPASLDMEESLQFLRERSQKNEVYLIENFGSKFKLADQGHLEVWTLEGDLSMNFSLPMLGVEVYHENHLIHVSEAVGNQSHEDLMSDFIELELGDYIVHENYGIGQFLGMVSLDKAGSTSDFILLQFSGGSKVYVPIAQLRLVQKFIGRGESTPELSKIGSKTWEMKKKKARKAIDRIVMELVHRQAFREKQVGYSFSPDSKEQRTFERAFPYTETPCQIQAAMKIKKEMEGNLPMDHLLCGDVGFGKTEIAMRAAHKAVIDGKQVAVLAPTTILAEQHYNSFVERFKDKSDWIGIINRFHGKAETDRTLQKVASGEVMILVGTHRLLSKDVGFLDLGLMILDEEQRFGVKQKEAMKKKHPNIDVLSLSATPIPRTLHMSMLGIRGISNLTIPPENRHAIRTYIREYDKGILKHAIQRELDRGGQAYVLHNRIEDMHEMEKELKGLFPSARIVVGHGQMSESQLSNVMKSFYALEVDIFLSTSIIANGIDMPTANTMLINNAHLFGLSELHQIRGRIGRYSIQAYCYLLLPGKVTLPPKSMRRLRAVEEHQELGAGFKLAMRDMEIRGVGNILGEDQHGQIADIGYDLYTQFLGQAIAEMKGEAPKLFIETDLVWPVGSTYFPKAFLSSHNDRIDFYRRISFSRSVEQLDAIQKELRDRFGIIPAATMQLLQLFRCKIRLRHMGVKALKRNKKIETATMEVIDWSNDLKLAWVLNNQKELAFYNEQQITLKLDKIWNRLTDEKVEQEPYQRYSYYNEDNRPEPLDVLSVLVDFIESTLKGAKKSIENQEDRVGST